MDNIITRLREFSSSTSAYGHNLCHEAADIIGTLSKIIEDLSADSLKENSDSSNIVEDQIISNESKINKLII